VIPLLAVGSVSATSAPAGGVEAPRHPARAASIRELAVTATATLLMDAGTGRVLYERNAHLAWPPASTTKIMTALVALESAPLDTPITISSATSRFRRGTAVGLPKGARIPLRDLLYALLLASGNDAALAIAEGVAGTVPAFVDRMNAKALELGATDTHFSSPHGLYDRAHVSTAYDLALITQAAMQNTTFRTIVQTRAWTLAIPGKSPRRLINHNRLLARYPGADGVKTGYLHQSGQTLVASATHHGLRLIAVVLNSRYIYRDAAQLLDFGFAHYHPSGVTASDLRRPLRPSERVPLVTRMVLLLLPQPPLV
jgi:D-alanyl-D-alanine carboxypeptidase (penicillin-binding protein 5/6)